MGVGVVELVVEVVPLSCEVGAPGPIHDPGDGSECRAMLPASVVTTACSMPPHFINLTPLDGKLTSGQSHTGHLTDAN